jgi:hypothetical protein
MNGLLGRCHFTGKAPPDRRIVAAAINKRLGMIRTGEEYRAGLRDGREIWIDGERVRDVTTHRAFRPVVDCKARMYDMAHEAASAGATATASRCARSPAATMSAIARFRGLTREATAPGHLETRVS